MSAVVLNVQFVQASVTGVEPVDMRAALLSGGNWLLLEGFDNGYDTTEAAVDQLHDQVQSGLFAAFG